MPLEDLFQGLADLGGEGKGWRSVWAILGLVAGAGIGGAIGWQTGLLEAAGGVGAGALIGWFGGVVFTGILRIAVFVLLVALAAGAWFWLTGAE